MNPVTQLSSALAGRYLIEREIGRGGMATVYLARDVRHNRPVALKVLNPELGAMLGVERFLAEIHVTAKLQHPNLLPLFDSGEACPEGTNGPGLLYYVMPYVEGESLRSTLTRERQLPIDRAVRITRAVAGALDYAHRHGVVHRDLKPENILLHEGEPLVADFGIALAVSKVGGARLTQTGLSLGTPQYMSPEQAAGDRVLDGRTDIYSLGCVLYEMLAGEPPHTGNTVQAVIAKVLTEPPRSVRMLRQTVPPGVEAALDRALAKVPADRFATAHEFAEALERRGERVTVSGDGAGNVPTIAAAQATVTPRRRVRTLLRLWQAAFGIAALAAGVAIWGWIAASRAEHPPVVRFTLPLAPTDPLWQLNRGNPLGISPDGNTVAYVGGLPSGTQQIFVRSVGDTHARALAGTDGASDPVFSPDGKWLAFITSDRLQKVAVEGGTVVTLAELHGTGGGMDWGPDDRIVVSVNGRLTSVPASGGALRPVTSSDSAHSYNRFWPRFSPDGKTVLFTRTRGDAGGTRIEAVSVETGRETELDLPGVFALGVIDDRLVYVSADGALWAVPFDARRVRVTGTPATIGIVVARGPQQLAKAALSPSGSLVYQTGTFVRQVVAVDGQGKARTLIAQPQQYFYPRFSPDGTRIALTIEATGSLQVWIYELASRTLTRLTTTASANQRPEWTPDGRRVLFRSDQGRGRSSLWWQPADGSGAAEPLLAGPGLDDVWEGVISPDGRTLVYRTGTLGSAVMWSRTTDGATAPRRLSPPGSFDWGARFSPDGRWLAYSSDQSGVRQVYVQPFPGPGARVQISDEGGDSPVWSPDGRRLFYVVGSERIMAATLAAGPTPRVVERKPVVEGYYFTALGHASYDVSPDGKELLLLKPVGGDAQVVVAHNWREELRARTATKLSR